MKKARAKHQTRVAKQADKLGWDPVDEAAWEVWCEGADQAPLHDALDLLDRHPRSERSTVRRRVGSVIDRWASKETDRWIKAEERIFSGRKRS